MVPGGQGTLAGAGLPQRHRCAPGACRSLPDDGPERSHQDEEPREQGDQGQAAVEPRAAIPSPGSLLPNSVRSSRMVGSETTRGPGDRPALEATHENIGSRAPIPSCRAECQP